MSLFINIPYNEKDEAKKLGAKWNPNVKKWYVTDRRNYCRFSKWILRDCEDALIVFNNIYIIEGEQRCWKCKRTTKVIGLGIREHLIINENTEISDLQDCYTESNIHLAWADNEDSIPPKLLRYLKEHYFVKTGYSKTLGEKCFANHCMYCQSLQGNYFLFQEVESPLSTMAESNTLIERMQKLKIYSIPIADDLQLFWEYGLCSNDYAYLKYGRVNELRLSDNPQNAVSYEELYDK